jgi:hypothetical protein
MRSRSIVLGGAALLLGSTLAVLLLTSSLAGQDRGGPAPKRRPDAAGVDRRLADMEAQLGKLLKEVQTLRNDLKAAPARAEKRMELNIFKLKNAHAEEMVRVLRELLTDGADNVRIIADVRTNSVLIRGPQEFMETAQAVLSRLDEEGERKVEKKPAGKEVRPEGRPEKSGKLR